MRIKSIFVVMMLSTICNVATGYGFQDKVHRYSIQLPKGWKVEKLKANGSVGAQAISKSGAQLVVGAAKQDTSGIEFSNEFAKFFTYKVTFPMASQMCENVKVVSAMAVTVLDRFDGIANNLICDTQRVQTMYFVNNGITYTITTVYNPADRESAQLIFNSLKTFRIL